MVNFSSLSDLLIHSCHCDKTDPLTRSHRKLHSASPELCITSTTTTACITDFSKSRREASNPLILPSLSEDLRDHDIDQDADNPSPRHGDSHKTVGGSTAAVATTPSEGKRERKNEEVNATDTTDGSTAVAHWIMRNPDKGIAMVQNKITQELVQWVLIHPEDGLALIHLLQENGEEVEAEDRRSHSQTFITTAGEEEKGLTKRQSTEQSRPTTSANSTECLTKAVTPTTSFTGGDRLVNAFAPGTMTFVMLKEDLKQHVLLPPTFRGHIYSDFSQLPVPFPYFSNPTVTSSNVHLVICVHGLEGMIQKHKRESESPVIVNINLESEVVGLDPANVGKLPVTPPS
ncbi:hypothetical protein TSMEX_006578 [Taenia solium]